MTQRDRGMPASLTVMLASVLVAVCGARTSAQTPADLVVLPLSLPGDSAPFEEAATSAIVARLQAAGASVKVAKAADPFALAYDAPALCAANGAQAIVTGRLRVEQTSTSGALGFIPYIGPLAKALVNTHPSHAVVTLDRIDCHGSVLARATGAGDDTHHGSNVGAGVTVSVQQAVNDAAGKLVGTTDVVSFGDVWLQTGARVSNGALMTRPQASLDMSTASSPASPSPLPASPSPASPSPTPLSPASSSSSTMRIALASVEDTFDPDPHEQFESSTLLKKLSVLGYDVAEVAPLDRFDVPRHANEICRTAGAARILASSIRYEQSAIDTFISTSYPTHAFMHFDILDCTGKVRKSEDISSNVHYQSANVGAAISKAIDDGAAAGLIKVGLTGEATPAR